MCLCLEARGHNHYLLRSPESHSHTAIGCVTRAASPFVRPVRGRFEPGRIHPAAPRRETYGFDVEPMARQRSAAGGETILRRILPRSNRETSMLPVDHKSFHTVVRPEAEIKENRASCAGPSPPGIGSRMVTGRAGVRGGS